jgi:hypothetical protein
MRRQCRAQPYDEVVAPNRPPQLSIMRLFDRYKRVYHAQAEDGESTYSFLNRSARPAAARVRLVVAIVERL